MVITTTFTATAAGATRIVAKSGGKQATVKPDLTRSADWNHGNAAGTLAAKLGLGAGHVHNPMTFVKSDAGGRGTFTITGV